MSKKLHINLLTHQLLILGCLQEVQKQSPATFCISTCPNMDCVYWTTFTTVSVTGIIGYKSYDGDQGVLGSVNTHVVWIVTPLA